MATIVALTLASSPTLARAQIPTPPPVPVVPAPAPPQIVAYRAPVLALVQPPPGGLTVPQDRPVVVFRFTQGEAVDPIDAASFRVAVDGHDRTAQFQVTATPGSAGEAWGPLGDASVSGAGALAAGAHQVTARLCSSRGACGTVEVTVTAMPVAAVETTTSNGKTGRRARVIELVLQATRKLLAP